MYISLFYLECFIYGEIETMRLLGIVNILLDLCVSLCTFLYVMRIYIYIERERDIDRESTSVS